MSDKKIIVALDLNNIKETINLVDEIKNEVFAFKIGYEFFLNFGLDGYKKIQNKEVKIFLDLKLHDIPNTIYNAMEAISKLNPYFTTIHISGGDEMQKKANLNKKNIKVLGVSILTSLDEAQSLKYYNVNDIDQLVNKFVNYAIQNSLDGCICSPKEIEIINKLRSSLKKNFDIITPGIRPENYSEEDDQKRFMTPSKAIKLGANYLVIGRPITKSNNPLKKLISINSSIE